MGSDEGPEKESKYVVVGEKAKAQLVSVVADDILKNVEYDALRIVFNKFRSIVILEREVEVGGQLGNLDSYEIEGGEIKSEVLPNLEEFQFSCVLFNAIVENVCSEQGARMSAMYSSSRNAGEMLARLTLAYNRMRQASIAKELIEIISGASALAWAESKRSKPLLLLCAFVVDLVLI
ncbi:gamma subunit of Mt ATP synthase [Actinidia rufa]|uniref:Gamma subunit of Mt ATP synthase n=1 Tax=Actinidia rufa TaxID=165716 RepID=A0A7J0GN84_9ERIC|nr:gamma subunit of Mt ATP synthase [Actinidia rufa]